MVAAKTGWRENSGAFSEREQALCSFADKLTRTPAAMSPSDLERLKGVGLDEGAILEAVHVIGYFNHIIGSRMPWESIPRLGWKLPPRVAPESPAPPRTPPLAPRMTGGPPVANRGSPTNGAAPLRNGWRYEGKAADDTRCARCSPTLG